MPSKIPSHAPNKTEERKELESSERKDRLRDRLRKGCVKQTKEKKRKGKHATQQPRFYNFTTSS